VDEPVAMKHNINMPDYAFTIRELENRDLPEVAQILANGFPRLSNAYWQNCLRIIKS
jgi:hypothetical protein